MQRYICKLLMIKEKMTQDVDYHFINIRGVPIMRISNLSMEKLCRCPYRMRKFHVLTECKNAEWNPIIRKCIFALKY